MKLDKIYENWKNFVNESKEDKERVIYEISDKTYDMFSDYLGVKYILTTSGLLACSTTNFVWLRR